MLIISNTDENDVTLSLQILKEIYQNFVEKAIDNSFNSYVYLHANKKFYNAQLTINYAQITDLTI